MTPKEEPESKKNNYNSQNHAGTLPIRVLQHNIISCFENTHPNFTSEIRECISQNGLSTKISYVANKSEEVGEKLTGPHVTIKEKEIHLQETFLSYLWCITYSLYKFTDFIIGEKIEQDIPEKTTTIKLFKYGISLANEYSTWNKEDLPNPEEYTSEWSDDIEKCNAIFLHGVNFILCHEYAHVYLKHCEEKSNKESFLESKEKELEADNLAAKLMKNQKNDKHETPEKFGIATSLSALLFLRSTVQSKTHPDTDNRILNILDTITENEDDRSWLISCAAILLWCELHEVKTSLINEKTFREAFVSLSRKLR